VLSQLKPAALLLAALTLLTGIAYPLIVTGLAWVFFADRASGSLLRREGRIVGSGRLGQPFHSPGYFWGRPSATAAYPYNAAASGGSNLGPTNPALAEAVVRRIAALRAAAPGNPAPIPIDLVTASASGLDPDISLAAARWQAGRVARARGVPQGDIDRLIDAHVEPPALGFLGEARVNVLQLNLALDALVREAP
jgi:potassium-transporting ATPase KdpC subunit